MFDDQIELYGVDFPSRVRRPAALTLALHFRIRKKPPAGHAIFVHLELPGMPLVNGDHSPVRGIFPTANWLDGEHIRDVYDIDLPLMTTEPGSYGVSFGFWPGGNFVKTRIPITAGAHDGQNRCILGRVEVL